MTLVCGVCGGCGSRSGVYDKQELVQIQEKLEMHVEARPHVEEQHWHTPCIDNVLEGCLGFALCAVLMASRPAQKQSKGCRKTAQSRKEKIDIFDPASWCHCPDTTCKSDRRF